MEAVYAQLCAFLTEALAGLGIAAEARSVEGSFCDGRFNLAVAGTRDGAPRKIAGTAQYWRRAGERHAVLAHALLIVDADPAMLTGAANRFEAALGSGRRYNAKSLTSVAQAWSAAHPGECPSASLSEEVTQRIAAALRH
jgi:lipoate-protein ligase A